MRTGRGVLGACGKGAECGTLPQLPPRTPPPRGHHVHGGVEDRGAVVACACPQAAHSSPRWAPGEAAPPGLALLVPAMSSRTPR